MLFFEAFFGEGMNHLVCIIGAPELVRMSEAIHTAVLHFQHVTFTVKDRLALDDDGKTACIGMRVIYHGHLFTKALIGDRRKFCVIDKV